MMTRIRLSVYAVAASILITSACGKSVEARPFNPTLTELHGTIDREAGATIDIPSDLRIALVWFRLENGKTVPSTVSQDAAVTPVFPSGFRMPVTALPPQESLMEFSAIPSFADYSPQDLDPNGRFAIGSLFVYVDGDGSGRLEVPFSGDSPPLDKALGTLAQEQTLIYYEGHAFTLNNFILHPGLNLVQTMTTDNGATETVTEVARASDRDLKVTIPKDPVGLLAYWCIGKLAESTQTNSETIDYTNLSDNWRCTQSEYADAQTLNVSFCFLPGTPCETCGSREETMIPGQTPPNWPCTDACRDISVAHIPADIDLASLPLDKWHCSPIDIPGGQPFGGSTLTVTYCDEQPKCKLCVDRYLSVLTGDTAPVGWPCL